MTQPSRKRQRKADSRVAELEKKLDALTAALTQQHHVAPAHFSPPQMTPAATPSSAPRSTGSSVPPPQHGPAMVSRAPMEAEPASKRQRTDDESGRYPSRDDAELRMRMSSAPQTLSRPSTKDEETISQEFRSINNAWGANPDLKQFLSRKSPEEFARRINRLVDPTTAAGLFDRYVTKMAPHLPAVVFPPSTTADKMWREKPILYVCIISAAASGILEPDVSRELVQEAVGAIADCVVRYGAKSLELIQSMQIMALWYKPPEKATQTNFYQIIHMAAVMALDIGLGKRYNPAKARRGFGGPNANFAPGPGNTIPQDSDTLEARRAWLCSYYLCASASMVLRRPNLVRWTQYMKECIEVLETHPDAFESDKLFAQHVKIQHICEDIGLQFLMDDNTANISIKDPKVTYALTVLENELKSWKEKVPPECRGPGLQFFEHVTSLYLHEIALHFDHNIEDFKLPFTEESLKSVTNVSDKLTQHQMAGLEACVKAAHGILDTLLGYGLEVVRTLPMLIFFVRCCYALVILIKMHVSISTPGSEVGKIMKADDLRVDHYMESLLSLFTQTTAEGSRPHPKIVAILSVLRDWFRKHQEGVLARERGEPVPAATSRPGYPAGDTRQRQQQHPYEHDHHNTAHQTPLQMLSNVAIGASNEQAGADNQSWTVTSPFPVNYSRIAPPGHPASRYTVHRQSTGAPYGAEPNGGSVSMAAGLPNAANTDQMHSVDPTNPGDFGWGSGFEQAMDMTMGGMDVLSGGGLDNWFLGDSMAPFAFNGDITAPAHW